MAGSRRPDSPWMSDTATDALLIVCLGTASASFIVRPLMTLAHELGHAVMALRFARGVVQVHVGRPPGLVRLGGRLRIAFSPQPTRGVSYGGITIFNARGVTPLQAVAILAAGPAVSALGTVALGVGTILAVRREPLVAWVLGVSALEGLLSVIWNLRTRPQPLNEHRARVGQPDGVSLVRAWRAHRGTRTLPPVPHPGPPRALRPRASTLTPSQRAESHTDTSGSVPPPETKDRLLTG